MKLKNILIPFAGVLLLTACEKDHRNDNLVDPRVYIVNNGVQTATYYDVEETLDYDIYAYSSGYFGQPSEVKVVLDPDAVETFNAANGSSYTLLGEEYYQIVKSTGSISAEGRRATLSIRLDCKEIMALPYMNDYVLPLRLTAAGTEVNEELNTILINPRMQETEVLAENAGVVESDLSAADANTLEFTAYTEFDNKWETTTEYAYGDEVLDAYNAEHGTNYLPIPTDAVTFTPAQLEVGKREAVSHFEIDKSKLTPDRFYTLAVQLKSNSEFKIGADNTVLYHIALNPLFTDRSKWILVACSSWYTGRGPELTIDGDVSTKFENRYNDIGQGDIETLPVTIDWDLGKTCYYAGMKLTRRNDSYVTDLKAGWIEMSDDGKTWMPLQSFDFEGSKTVVGDFRSEQWFGAGRYLRLKMTESGRPGRKLVSVCEFEPVLIDAGE